MSTWDYGQAEQVAHEWDEAVKAGFCRICTIRKKETKGGLCDKCDDEVNEARNVIDSY
jgi:hypothetical protein